MRKCTEAGGPLPCLTKGVSVLGSRGEERLRKHPSQARAETRPCPAALQGTRHLPPPARKKAPLGVSVEPGSPGRKAVTQLWQRTAGKM